MKNYKEETKKRLINNYRLADSLVNELMESYPIGSLREGASDYFGYRKDSLIPLYLMKGSHWLCYDSTELKFKTPDTDNMRKFYKNKMLKLSTCKDIVKYLGELINCAHITDLQQKKPTNCSKGEELLYEIFTTFPWSKKVQYQTEFWIDELKGKYYWERTPRFDGVVISKETGKKIFFIEYDGQQHTNNKSENWSELRLQQLRDACKDGWANAQGVPCIRIPYTCTTKKDIEEYIFAFLQSYNFNLLLQLYEKS